MVPLRFVFRSRWWALAWAAGICWSAVEFGQGSADPDLDVNATNATAALFE